MSSDTLSTTLRCLNHFISPWATRPSTARRSSVPAVACRALRAPIRGLAFARVEDGLHALLLAALDDRAILREINRDRVSAHEVVVLPHPGTPEQQHALLEIRVLGAPCGGGAAILGDDPHGPRRHRALDTLALLVEIDLHALGVLHRVVLAGDDVAREDDQALLAETLHLVGVDGQRLAAIVLRPGARARGRLRVGGSGRRPQAGRGG